VMYADLLRKIFRSRSAPFTWTRPSTPLVLLVNKETNSIHWWRSLI
jgi:hypothetical protein